MFLDITATVEGREATHDVIARTAEQVFIPLTVGGGVREPDDVRRLLRAGADKVVVATDPSTVCRNCRAPRGPISSFQRGARVGRSRARTLPHPLLIVVLEPCRIDGSEDQVSRVGRSVVEGGAEADVLVAYVRVKHGRVVRVNRDVQALVEHGPDRRSLDLGRPAAKRRASEGGRERDFSARTRPSTSGSSSTWYAMVDALAPKEVRSVVT